MVTVYRSDSARAGIVLGHGAGAGQQSSFMVRAGHELAARGVTTATFDFPYVTAGRKVPDKAPVLEASWREVLADVQSRPEFHGRPLFIGGKSMGGRMASHVAAQHAEGIAGLVFFGYPLHPPGRPGQRRDAHLRSIREPMLFIQGTRDQFGTAAEIRALLPGLNGASRVFEVADGDHSFKTRVKVVGKSGDAVLAEVFDAAAAFILAP